MGVGGLFQDTLPPANNRKEPTPERRRNAVAMGRSLDHQGPEDALRHRALRDHQEQQGPLRPPRQHGYRGYSGEKAIMKKSLRKKRIEIPEPVVTYCEVEVTEKTQEGVNRAFNELFEEVMRRRRLPTASRSHTPPLRHNVFVK